MYLESIIPAENCLINQLPLESTNCLNFPSSRLGDFYAVGRAPVAGAAVGRAVAAEGLGLDGGVWGGRDERRY